MIKNPIVFILVFLAISICPVYVLSSGIEGIEGGIDTIQCPDCRVEVLVGGEYFDALHKAIGEAKDSIYVAMYLMMRSDDEGHPVDSLLEGLIKAHKRGVSINVILDDDKYIANNSACKRLESEGIWVRFDTPRAILHSKIVIIDKRISIIGSSNWTKGAFLANYEANVLIESRYAAKRYIDHFLSINVREDKADPIIGLKGIRLPGVLLTSTDKLSGLYSSRADRSFDLYLLLRKISEENGSDIITVDHEYIGRSIGYKRPEDQGITDPDSIKDYYYTRIIGLMQTLKNRYGLIDYVPRKKEIKILHPAGDDGYFILPFAYFEYGLNKKLSFSAKFAYLICLLEARQSDKNPCWFRSIKDLSGTYHGSKRDLSRGIVELERFNLLEVYRHIPRDFTRMSNRPANDYCLNPLMSDEGFKAGIETLYEKYGEDVTEKARKFSSFLNEPRDLNDIETFIRLFDEYGYENVKRTVMKTKDYGLSTGLKDISTVIRLLKDRIKE